MTFSVGRFAPGRWLTHPKERHDVWNLQKRKNRRAAAEIKKFEKRDLAQAVITLHTWWLYADGECEASEKAKIEQVLRTQPAYSSHFFDTDFAFILIPLKNADSNLFDTKAATAFLLSFRMSF